MPHPRSPYPFYELRARMEPALAERILGYVRRVPGRTISEFLIEAALRFGRLERRQGIRQIAGTQLAQKRNRIVGSNKGLKFFKCWSSLAHISYGSFAPLFSEFPS